MTKKKAAFIFDTIFLVLFFILIFGTPIAFTSYTRSVFEVNKLLLLRFVTIFTYAIWLFRYVLFKDSNTNQDSDENDEKKYYHFFNFKFKKIGLEIPILIWLVINVISTIFSQNIIVAIIGAYDRWEGIITIVNYMLLIMMFAKLVTKKFQVHWLLGGGLIATVASSIYGILQSRGFDFMHWSVDPTKRVFACINNPVHFCAYMAMFIPVGIGIIHLIASKQNSSNNKNSIKHELFKWGIFICIALVYYAQFLSFSKATWLGFVGAMTLLYFYILDLFSSKTSKCFIIDFFFSSTAIGAFYLFDIFKIYKKGILVTIPIAVLLIAYVYYSYLVSKEKTILNPEESSGILMVLTTFILLFAFFFDMSGFNKGLALTSQVFFSIIFLILCLKAENPIKIFLERLLLIIIFAKLQFITASLSALILYLVLLAGYLILIYRNTDLYFEKKFWISTITIMLSVIISIQSVPILFAELAHNKNIKNIEALDTVQGKVNEYNKIAIQGTARTSMWKSSLPWIKDFWLIGSGPDTIKYMYPKYRRVDYGILEGGHNFTPDRLHNEYLNTLATRGVTGFIAYYFGVIIGWFIITLQRLYTMPRKNPYRYIIFGLITGCSIYLGQVLFNFGVVATLVLFYIFMGLALAMVTHPDIREHNS
jgi:hypothetical protein